MPLTGVRVNFVRLFGSWAATEEPRKQMQIENPSVYQQQRLADQQ